MIGEMTPDLPPCFLTFNHLCRLDTLGEGSGDTPPLPLNLSIPQGGCLPSPPVPNLRDNHFFLNGQATDPGAEIETGETILPNEREEGGDAGRVRDSRRASKGQEHQEPAEKTTEMQHHHPHPQTSKPRWEGNVRTWHPSQAGASLWAGATETTTPSPDILTGYWEGWATGGELWQPHRAKCPPEDLFIQAAENSHSSVLFPP